MPNPRRKGTHAPTPVTSARRAVSLSSRRTPHFVFDRTQTNQWLHVNAIAGIDTLTLGSRPVGALRSPFMQRQLSHRSKNFALRSETVGVSDG